MIVANIIFSLIYAVIITAVFTLIFKKNGPWDGFWLLFVLVLLASIGAGRWVSPIGPAAWGFHWLPGLIAAIIFALLVAAATPESKPDKRKVDEQTEVNALAVNFFFIILIIILVILAIAGVIHYD